MFLLDQLVGELRAHLRALALLAETADPYTFYLLDQEMEALEWQLEILERQTNDGH